MPAYIRVYTTTTRVLLVCFCCLHPCLLVDAFACGIYLLFVVFLFCFLSSRVGIIARCSPLGYVPCRCWAEAAVVLCTKPSPSKHSTSSPSKSAFRAFASCLIASFNWVTACCYLFSRVAALLAFAGCILFAFLLMHLALLPGTSMHTHIRISMKCVHGRVCTTQCMHVQVISVYEVEQRQQILAELKALAKAQYPSMLMPDSSHSSSPPSSSSIFSTVHESSCPRSPSPPSPSMSTSSAPHSRPHSLSPAPSHVAPASSSSRSPSSCSYPQTETVATLPRATQTPSPPSLLPAASSSPSGPASSWLTPPSTTPVSSSTLCPSLVRFFGAFFQAGAIHLVLEYCPGGSLQNLIDRTGNNTTAMQNSDTNKLLQLCPCIIFVLCVCFCQGLCRRTQFNLSRFNCCKHLYSLAAQYGIALASGQVSPPLERFFLFAVLSLLFPIYPLLCSLLYLLCLLACLLSVHVGASRREARQYTARPSW